MIIKGVALLSAMTCFSRRAPALVAGVLLAMALMDDAGAESATNIRYNVSVTGLSIGTARVAINTNGARYSANFTGRITGIARIFAGGRASATSSGTIGRSRLVPSRFDARVTSGSESRSVGMSFGRGSVSGLTVTPPFPEEEGRTPVTNRHRRNVLDPLAGMVARAPRGALTASKGCGQTVPIFDGRSRYDISLNPVRTETIEVGGRDIQAVVCSVRFRPIAGVRASARGNPSRPVNVWLAPIGDGRLLAPARIVGETRFGTMRITTQDASAFANSDS